MKKDKLTFPEKFKDTIKIGALEVYGWTSGSCFQECSAIHFSLLSRTAV